MVKSVTKTLISHFGDIFVQDTLILLAARELIRVCVLLSRENEIGPIEKLNESLESEAGCRR